MYLKLTDKIKNSRNTLLIFNHGLGDLILFLPVFYELQKQVRCRLSLGSHGKREFHLINKDIIDLNSPEFELSRSYDFIKKIDYPDSSNPSSLIEYHNEPPKPYLCILHELNMKSFIWKPYRMDNQYDYQNSDKIGFHFFGHTGVSKKGCPIDIAKTIWNEVADNGYSPFECHMIPSFSKEYKDHNIGDNFSVANESNSLRFMKPSMKVLIDSIARCSFFIGVDSGPIYLATALLGPDRVIGLVNKKQHNQFIPYHITTVNVNNYRKGAITEIIKQKMEWVN